MIESSHIIIKGLTQSGSDFRPADWAERLAGRLCRFVHRKMMYSPLLKPCVYEGVRALSIAPELAKEHPSLFWDLIHFAKINHLQVINDSAINLDDFMDA
jgi:hypothetical protein